MHAPTKKTVAMVTGQIKGSDVGEEELRNNKVRNMKHMY